MGPIVSAASAVSVGMSLSAVAVWSAGLGVGVSSPGASASGFDDPKVHPKGMSYSRVHDRRDRDRPKSRYLTQTIRNKGRIPSK